MKVLKYSKIKLFMLVLLGYPIVVIPTIGLSKLTPQCTWAPPRDINPLFTKIYATSNPNEVALVSADRNGDGQLFQIIFDITSLEIRDLSLSDEIYDNKVIDASSWNADGRSDNKGTSCTWDPAFTWEFDSNKLEYLIPNPDDGIFDGRIDLIVHLVQFSSEGDQENPPSALLRFVSLKTGNVSSTIKIYHLSDSEYEVVGDSSIDSDVGGDLRLKLSDNGSWVLIAISTMILIRRLYARKTKF